MSESEAAPATSNDDLTGTTVTVIYFFAICFLSGSAPYYLHKSVQSTLVLNLCNCFAAGVFLGTCLLHMLPETRIMLSQANFDDHFPYAEVYVCSGFFLVLFLEQSVLSVYGEHSHSHGDPGKGEGNSVDDTGKGENFDVFCMCFKSVLNLL